MKKLFILLLQFIFLNGCISIPKYKINDCIMINAMEINKENEWLSSSKNLGDFKIVDIKKTTKQNKYMANRLHSNYIYIMEDIDFNKNNRLGGGKRFIIPVKDLDNYRYAMIFWELPENKKYNCNDYTKK